MSKEVNTNRGYYRPGKKMDYSINSFSDGSKSRSYTRDDMSGSANPTFTKDVDMRQLNCATTNDVTDSYDSTWSSNTREAKGGPMNIFNSYPFSFSNSGGTTNHLGKGQYNDERSDSIQGPVSTSNVVRSTFADSFVTYNQDPMSTVQQHKMEKDSIHDIVNPIPLQNYTTMSVPDSNISSGQSMWQDNQKNANMKVVPAVEHKGRPQNPHDPRFILFPKEPTFNVKIIGGVRIAQQVIKISYRKSLKSTAVYTVGRKGGSCKKAMAESKRKRALWWISQGKTIEDAILLCLRPYHEVYEEIVKEKLSWGTPMMIRNLLEQINKEGAYNPFIGRPQANDSESSDDSADEATEQLIKPEAESNQGYFSTNNDLDLNVEQNLGQNSNNMLGSLPNQDNIQNMPTKQETENGSSQNAYYDPKSHFLSSLAVRNRPLPVNSESVSDFIHTNIENYSLSRLADHGRPLPVHPEPVSDLIDTKTDNYSLSSLADCDRHLPVIPKPVSDFIYTKRDNPYTKVNTKTKMIKINKDIKGAALRRYYYWLNAGKTPSVAKGLCVLKMNQIPLYKKIKGTVGTLKSFVKRSQNQRRFRQNLSVADTGPASIVDKTEYCENVNDFTENVYVRNPQEESESYIPENTEGSEHGLENTNTSKTQVTYLDEIEQYIKSLTCGSIRYKKYFNPVAINKYRWWRLVGRTIREAQKMCVHPLHRYPKEYKEGVKIIDFKTFMLKDTANLNIAEETAECPTDFEAMKKKIYFYWIKLGKTPKEAADFTLQNFLPQKRNKHYVDRVKKRQEYMSTFQSSGHTYPSVSQSSQNKNNCDSSSVSIIPTIQIQPTFEENLAKDTDDYDVAHTGDFKNAKKQVEPATQLTNAELIRFEWWKKQGKSEEEARKLCHKSIAVSEFLNRILSNKKEGDVACNTEGSKSIIADLSQNLRREEISNKQIFKENATNAEAMAETNFVQNVVAQKGLNVPITQNLVVPGNVKESEQGEFKVCIKANKVKMDFDDFKAIKNSLDLCIADEDGIKIKSFNKRNNRVIITCLNEKTRDWLDKQIPTLVPWENAQLEIIDEDEVPIDILARFFVAFDTEAECSSVTPEQFMQHLHEQNPDVGCDRWMVQKVETKTYPIGFYVLGLIDNKSKDVLTSKNFKLKWFDKRNIKVKISSTNKKKSKAESGARAVLFVPKVPECRLHSSQQYLLNRLHKLNPTVGCDGWTIVQKRIKPDGAALLVRLNHASKQKVENIKKIHWYRSQNIVVTIVPIYVDINLPIDSESTYLRIIPQNQITKTIINKLHFFNPSFGCLTWVMVQLQDNDEQWHLTFKINEKCHQTLIQSNYKLYWYGGRWLEVKLGTVPELEMFESKKNTKHSKNSAKSYQPTENAAKSNKNQNASGSLLSPQLTTDEESKVQDASNRGLPPSILWNNPENHPAIAMFSSSRQDSTDGMSYTEREPYHYERRKRAVSVCNEKHQLSPALEYSLIEVPEYARPPDGHCQENLGLVGFGDKKDVAQERYSYGIRRYDDDRDIGSETRNKGAKYPNTEHRNIENEDYNNDDCKQNYYNNENRLEEEERGHTPYPDSDNIVNQDPRSNDEYMHQDIEGYHFDEHYKVDTREIDYEREERKIDRGGLSFGREEKNINGEERNFNTEEEYYGREGINFERGQNYFDREILPQDGARLDFEHRPCQETEYFQREWSSNHQNINKYVERRKRSHYRDEQWGQKWPHLRPEQRETLHDSRESQNQNKLARASEDRRHDALINRLKGLADYHDRQHHYHESSSHHYHESSSYSNRGWQNSRRSFDEPPSKSRRRRR